MRKNKVTDHRAILSNILNAVLATAWMRGGGSGDTTAWALWGPAHANGSVSVSGAWNKDVTMTPFR